MKFLVPLIVLLITLLFVGGPSYHDGRLYKELWESGHFILFAMIIFTLMQIKKINRQPRFLLLLLVGLLGVTGGLLSEIIQLAVGRDFQLTDVGNDVIGGYAGYLFANLFSVVKQRWQNNRDVRIFNFKNLTSIFVLVILAMIGSREFLIAVVDQWNIKQEFPVLSDIESPLELSRWDERDSEVTISSEHVRHGKYAMAIRFLATRYPDVSLEYFNQDWSSYRQLRFSLYNSENKPLEVEAKIYDRKHHRSGFRYSDRFNRLLLIKPGWNDIIFNLEEVEDAPQSRKMKMDEITSFSLFMERPKTPITVYLDNLRLTR